MDDAIAVVDRVSKKYKSGDFWRPLKAQALREVSLSLYRREVFGLVGLNGAGKSTLMKVMIGLLKPDSGRVLLFGRDAGSLAARPKFGYLPELPSFPKYLSAWEVLHFYGRLHSMAGGALTKRVQEVLELVGLWGRARSPIREYSKGMQQRVGMAQALLHEPELLFLDEPMSGLDPMGTKEFRDLLLNMKNAGKTLFFNTHNLSEVEKLCDRVGLMAGGRMKVVDSVPNLVARHQSWVSLGFVKLDSRALAWLRRAKLRPRLENRIWNLRVRTESLKAVLAGLAPFHTSRPAVLSLGSPLETAFLKVMEEA